MRMPIVATGNAQICTKKALTATRGPSTSMRHRRSYPGMRTSNISPLFGSYFGFAVPAYVVLNMSAVKGSSARYMRNLNENWLVRHTAIYSNSR